MSNLVVGIATVKLSTSAKLRIRSRQSNGLIVKLFGRSVGYHFFQTKILSLQKLVGRMDCVDLDKGYFRIRFVEKDDFEKLLKGGPWFVGGHFLSIRAQEPNFRLSTVSLSTVAVWVRLLELLIKYYDAEVIREIGEAIGPVFKVDVNTTMEARG